MAKLNKQDVIESLAQKLDLPKKQAEDMLESFLDLITETLKKGDEVFLTGFGSFSAKTRKGRIGINPKKPSEKVQIPPTIVPRFKAGKSLKDSLRGNSNTNSGSTTATTNPTN